MFRKKILLAGTAAALAFSLSVFPAFAHGHHGGHHGNRTAVTVPDTNYNSGAADSTDTGYSADTDTTAVPGAYPVCTFEGCTETGRHLHDGSYYCGYHHDGGYCDGSCVSSGAYPVCTFEGCTETGRHLHDGNYYCGYLHSGGYCDGSCIGSSPAISNPPAADNSPAADNPPAAGNYSYGRRYGCHRSYAKKMIYCH